MPLLRFHHGHRRLGLQTKGSPSSKYKKSNEMERNTSGAIFAWLSAHSFIQVSPWCSGRTEIWSLCSMSGGEEVGKWSCTLGPCGGPLEICKSFNQKLQVCSRARHCNFKAPHVIPMGDQG